MEEQPEPKKVIRDAKALYEVLSDVFTLEKEPIFVNIGQTRAVLLSEAHYLELTKPRTEDERIEKMLEPLKPEIEAFEQMLPELLKEHKGKWVAIHGGEVVGMSERKQEILDLIVTERYEPVLFRQVQVEPRFDEIPRVERVRDVEV